MADIDLPLWSVPPNWSKGVTERLEWLTNVMTSTTGAEQRRAVRETPRRWFDFTINPIDNVRTFVDLWLHNLADKECLLPLWHDRAKLSAAVSEDDTRIEFDNTWREFVVGGLAVIFKDAFTYEVVEIEAMDDTGLDLASPIAADWPQGSVVHPVRRCWLEPELSSDAITSRVGETVMRFLVNQANPFDGGAETLTIYGGYPLIEIEPNRMDALTTQYSRIMEELDQQIGLVGRYDVAKRAFPTQFYNWQARGREQGYKLRQFFYRLNGRQKAVWMPTFNQDVQLARPLLNIGVSLNVRQIGYAMTGGAKPGREHIMMKGNDGANHIVQISGTAVALAPGEERLTLTGQSGFSAPTGRSGSFLDTYRLDQDTLEITHHTDSEGVCEASAAFKVFSDTRSITGPLILPTAIVAMSEGSCGTSEEGNTCLPTVFNGWDFEVWGIATFSQVNRGGGFYIHVPGSGALGSATGGAIGDTSMLPAAGPLTQVALRRVNLGPEAGYGDRNTPPQPYVGDWHAYWDLDYINYFGAQPPLNEAHVQIYCRHWTQAFPGNKVYDETITGGRPYVTVPLTVDWRDWR